MATENMESIVVSGCGAVSPFGIGVRELRAGLSEGISGISPITEYDLPGCSTRKGGYFRGFDPHVYDESKEFTRVARGTQFALIASDQALCEASCDPAEVPSAQLGLVFSSTRVALEKTEQHYQTLLTQGPRSTSPLVFQETVNNASASHITLRHGITGPCLTLTSGGPGFFQGIATATGWLRRGKVQMALVVGVEALTPINQLPYCHAFGHAPVRRSGDDECCPFDRRRNGYLLGEAAVAVVLETASHAALRRVRARARLLGWGFSHDAYRAGRYHPQGHGLERSIVQALDDSRLLPADIDWVVASANASASGDVAEARALRRAWDGSDPLPAVSAIKSMLGETEGAAGGLGLLAGVLGIEHGLLFPTINYREPDPACELDCVPDEARSGNPQRVLVNALGFGGGCASLVLAGANAS